MRGRLWLILLILAGLVLVGVIAVVVFGGRAADHPEGIEPPEVAEPEDPWDSAEETPVQVSGTEITAREHGEVVWRATFSGEIEIDERAGTARAEEVKWYFEGEGFDALSLEAPLMEADYGQRLLSFSRGVRIEAEDGRLQFAASAVEYQFNTRKLIGSGDVWMRSGDYMLTGTRLVIDNATEKIRVSNGTLRKER